MVDSLNSHKTPPSPDSFCTPQIIRPSQPICSLQPSGSGSPRTSNSLLSIPPPWSTHSSQPVQSPRTSRSPLTSRSSRSSRSPRIHRSPRSPRIRRGPGGKFISKGAHSIQKQRHLQRQNNYIMKRSKLREAIFDGYLDALFLHGSERESLPYARSDGPLVTLFEKIIKKPFRLGRLERLKKTRCFYLSGDYIFGREKGKWLDANGKALRLPSKPSKYIGARFPRFSRSPTEKKIVEKWLTNLHANKSLGVSSVSYALEICRQVFETYSPIIKKKRLRTQSSRNDQSGASGHIDDGTRASETQILASSGSNNLITFVDDARHREIIQQPPEILSPYREQGESEENYLLRKRKILLNMSMDTDLYVMICLCLDLDRMEEFQVFVILYQRECTRKKIEPPVLFKDIIIYAHDRKRGIASNQAHLLREKRIICTRKILEEARIMNSQKLYHDVFLGTA